MCGGIVSHCLGVFNERFNPPTIAAANFLALFENDSRSNLTTLSQLPPYFGILEPAQKCWQVHEVWPLWRMLKHRTQRDEAGQVNSLAHVIDTHQDSRFPAALVK